LILELVVASTACRRDNSRINFHVSAAGFGVMLILELLMRHAVDVTTNSRINWGERGVIVRDWAITD
jgi:hypothetical protein